MVIHQGEIWWAELAAPIGSAPGYRRPVLIVQRDALNQSRISTVICVILTSQLKWAEVPGNILLTARASGLPRDSVANSSQIVTIDRNALLECAGRITEAKLAQVLEGICAAIGR